MAKHGTVIIKRKPIYGGDLLRLPRASTVVVFVGDFLSLESSTMVLMDTVTEDITFAGIAGSQHETGDEKRVTSYLRCQIEVDCTSASYDLGAPLLYVAGSATVEYSVADGSAANTIMWSAEITATVTRLLVDVDVRALNKLWAVAA